MPRPGHGFLAAALLASLTPCLAQLPFARLDWIRPAGARPGTTNEVVVAGSDLDGSTRLEFSDPRVSGVPIPGQDNRFRVVVPDEMPTGLLDVRIVGRFGASNPRAFAIDPHPSIPVPDSARTETTPCELPPGTTADGWVAPGQATWFRIPTQPGQNLVVHVAARDLDSRLVPDLIVTGPDGRERARARGREWLRFTAPETGGACILRLQDQAYRGGGDHPFRLTCTDGPRVVFTLPAALTPGRTQTVALYGWNLPGGTPTDRTGPDGEALERATVEITPPGTDAAPQPAFGGLPPLGTVALGRDAFEASLPGTDGHGTPVPFALSPHPVRVSEADGIVAVTPPCDFTGFFPRRGTPGGIRFEADKGTVYWIELFSARLGFPTDPEAVVQRLENGAADSPAQTAVEIARLSDDDARPSDREFDARSRDAAVRFEAPETGTYRIVVRDRFHLGDSRPRYPYRLVVRPAAPDFRLVTLTAGAPRTGDDRRLQALPLALRRGETLALQTLALRQDGFDGEIALHAPRLPDGITAHPGRILPGQSTGTLLLTASETADGVGAVVVEGTATLPDGPVSRSARVATLVRPVPDFNNEAPQPRLERAPVVSVVSAEPAPIAVHPASTGPIRITAGSPVTIPLRIVRAEGFAGAFKLRPAGHPILDKAPELEIPEKAAEFTAEVRPPEGSLPPGEHRLWFQGSITGSYRNDPDGFARADAELKAATDAVAAAAEPDKPAAEERRKAAEAARKAAEAKAAPRNITVGVWSTPVTVSVAPAPAP